MQLNKQQSTANQNDVSLFENFHAQWAAAEDHKTKNT